MDGNLCAHKTDMLVTMHHQGKFRGVDFEPMSFELLAVTARKLIDAKGRHIPTVIARDLSKDDQREKNREARSDEDAILVLLFRRTKSTSLNDIASELGWFAGSDNHPNKSKVQRLIKDLTRGSGTIGGSRPRRDEADEKGIHRRCRRRWNCCRCRCRRSHGSRHQPRTGHETHAVRPGRSRCPTGLTTTRWLRRNL